MVLYIASGLIVVRCVYRVVEYAHDQTEALQSHEYYDYIFDTALVFLVMLLQVVPTEKIAYDEPELMYA